MRADVINAADSTVPLRSGALFPIASLPAFESVFVFVGDAVALAPDVNDVLHSATYSGKAGETRYKLARALSIFDRQIRRQ